MRGGNRVSADDPFDPDGPPSRPKSLDEAENRYWTLLSEQIPERLLRRVDAHQLENLVNLLAMRDRIARAIKDDPGDLKSGRLFLQVVAQIGKLSVLFGLSPIDRQRLRIKSEPTADDNVAVQYLKDLMSGS